MIEDDDAKPQQPAKPNLQLMSIEALQEYIADLQAEIDRAQAMIDQKQGLRGAADSLFKR